MQQQQQGDFQAVWGYPNEVLETIKEATRYEVHPAPPRSSGVAATYMYKIGRPRYHATFYKDGTVKEINKITGKKKLESQFEVLL